MMLMLRGLPPDIEVSEIRGYIHGRCTVGRVLLDELEEDTAGTRRVTVATTSDADAVTLRRALTGARLGVYTLFVEPYHPPDISDKGRPGDHGGYGRREHGASVGHSGNNDFEGLNRGSGRGGHSYRGLGRNHERGGSGKRDGGGSRGRGGSFEGDRRGLEGHRRSYGRDSGDYSSHGGSFEGDRGGLEDHRGNNRRDSSGLSSHGGSYEGDSGGFRGGRDGGGLEGLGRNNMRDISGFSGPGRGRGNTYGGGGGLGPHRGQIHGSHGLGKRYSGDDSIGGSSFKRRRDISERDDGFGRGSGDTFDRSKGPNVPTSSRGRGGYSGPYKSRGGGYKDANNSRDSGAFGGYSRDCEPDRFSGGSGHGGRNAMREPSPAAYDNRREGREGPLWEHSQIEEDQQSVEMEDCPLVAESRAEEYSQARGYSREREYSMQTSRIHQQNRAPDSGRFEEGSGLSSGREPWLADRMQVTVEGPRGRSQSPVRGGPPRRESAWESERGRAHLARRPADRAMPNRQRPRSRSPYPAFRGARPPAVHQQREPPFEPSAPRVMTAPWAAPKPMPPLLSIAPSSNSDFNNKTQPAKNKALLATPQIMKNQKFPLISAKPEKPGLKSDSIYKIVASKILNSMVSFKKVKPSHIGIAKSFAIVMKHLIEKRLRELTNQNPFNKDLVSIYREAYPPSTDEESLKSVSKELSLPEIPIPLKVLATNQRTLKSKFSRIIEKNFNDLPKFVNPHIKVETNSKKIIEDNVEASRMQVRVGAIIADQLMKIDDKGHTNSPNVEELRLRPFLKDVIATELARFPQKEFLENQDVNVILRMYHEKTDPDRNRHLIDVAVVNCNTKTHVPYSGIFTMPEKAAVVMQLWPDLYLKPGEVPPTSAHATKVSKDVKIQMWVDYASTVIASEVFVRHRVKYQMHKDELSINEVQHRVRSWLKDRLNDLMPSDTSEIVSTYSLVALYRRAYPQETDAELLKEVIKQLLEEAAIRGDTYLETGPVRKMTTSVTIAVASETVYGRQITAEERGQLRRLQRKLLVDMQTHIRKRIRRLLSRRNAPVHSEGQIRAAYREEFPPRDDAEFVRAVIRELDTSDAGARGHGPGLQLDDVPAGEQRAAATRKDLPRSKRHPPAGDLKARMMRKAEMKPAASKNIGQRNVNDVKPASGDSSEKTNFTTSTVEDDGMNTTNTDDIEDSYDIEVNDDDLEDY